MVERRDVVAKRSPVERGSRLVFNRLPAGMQRRTRALLIRRSTRHPERRPSEQPFRIPGDGPQSFCDLRGRTWDNVVDLVERRSASERLVVVTDQPMMHVARELPCVIEYVPASLSTVEVATRLDELRRVYGLDDGQARAVAGRSRSTATLLRMLLRVTALTFVVTMTVSVALLVIGFAEGWGSSAMVPLAIILAVGVGAGISGAAVVVRRLVGLARSTQHYSKLTSERTAIIRPAVGQLSSSLQEYARLARDRPGARSSQQKSAGSPDDRESRTLLVLAFGENVDTAAMGDAIGRLARGRVVVATDRAEIVPDLAKSISVEFVPEAAVGPVGSTLARLMEIAASCGASDVVVWPDASDVLDVSSADLSDLSVLEALSLVGVASTDRRLGQMAAMVTKVALDTKAIPVETERRAAARSQREDRQLRKYIDEVYQQAESLQRLYQRLDVPRGMPPMRGWAVSPDLAAHLVDLVLDGSVCEALETGSGTSTVLLALAFEQVGGGHVTALEHDAQYAQQTTDLLVSYGIAHRATLTVAPLIEYETDGEKFMWYDIASLAVGQPVDLLLVDGPPESIGPRSRYPALPLLAGLLADEALVILDDGRRDDETIIAEQWEQRPDITRAASLAMERRPISLSFVRQDPQAHGAVDGARTSSMEDT